MDRTLEDFVAYCEGGEMSEREKIARYIAQHFLGADCESRALEHADAILELFKSSTPIAKEGK